MRFSQRWPRVSSSRVNRDTKALRPLALEVDLRATYVFAELFIGDMDEERFRWTYNLYRKVAQVMRNDFHGGSGVRQLGSVRFRLGTFTDLEPWLEREVLGDRFLGTVQQPIKMGRPRILSERVPASDRCLRIV